MSNVFEPLLEAEEAASMLRMHIKTLQRMARNGIVPCYRIGKGWYFRASELDSWLRSSVKSGSQLRCVN